MIGRIKYPIWHLDNEDKRIPDIRPCELDEYLHTYHYVEAHTPGEKRYLVNGSGKNHNGSVRAFPIFSVPDLEWAKEICDHRNNGNGNGKIKS